MTSSKKNADEVIEILQKFSDDELLTRTTNLYISTLPEELRTVIYCSAILRWFDDNVLRAVLASKELIDAGHSFSADFIDSAYQQLQRLTFVEPYPGRGYTLHELTRKSLLESLWTDDRDFYRLISEAAFIYFEFKIDKERIEYQSEKITEDQLDDGLLVEMLYHQVITQESEALHHWQEVMNFLFDNQNLGLHHDMIVALEDHIKGGRLDKSLYSFTSLWKAREAFANWELELLQHYALPLADSNRQEFPDEVIVGALELLGWDAERRAQYVSAREFFERYLVQLEILEDPDGVVQALIRLSRVTLSSEDYTACREYIDKSLKRWIANNRILVDGDNEDNAIPPLRFQEPTLWTRQELEVMLEGEDSENPVGVNDIEPDIQQDDSNQWLVLYYIAKDDGSDEEAPDQLGPMWAFPADEAIAEIWLIAANLAEIEENFDHASACARLSGMIYTDINNLSGALEAVSVLERMGARELDHELMQFTADYRHSITERAASGGDQFTLLQGLVSEARSLAERLQLDDARKKWNEALSVSTDMSLDISRAACLQGLAEIEWSEGNIAKARELFTSTIKQYRGLDNLDGLAGTLLSRSDLESSQREFSDAKIYADQALETYTHLGSILGQFDTFQRMANIFREEGEYDQAFAFHRKALDIARQNKRASLVAIVLSSIADLELALGRKTAAESKYDDAISIAHKSRQYSLENQILLNKAQTLTDLAEYAQANNIIDHILKSNDQDPQAWGLKGWCLDYLGPDNTDEAIEARERAIEVAPTEITTHRDLADAFERHGKKRQAEAKRQWIVQEFGANPIPLDLPSLGWCYYKLGDFEKAESAFKEAIAVSSDLASDHFDLALVLASKGQLANAISTYERAISALSCRLPPRTRLGLLFVAIHDLEDLIDRAPSLKETPEIAQMRTLLVQAKAAALSEN